MQVANVRGFVFPRSNLLFIISSPSGAGKTTLTNRLLLSDPSVRASISATTRKKREGEIDGKDYIFLGEKAFLKEKERGNFLETAQIFDAHYGTPKKTVSTLLEQGFDVLFDVNWEGADAITQACPGQCVRIFILPPSLGVLEERLRARALDTKNAITKRLAAAEKEMARWPTYDYIVTNDDLGDALSDLLSILRAERLRSQRFHAQA